MTLNLNFKKQTLDKSISAAWVATYSLTRIKEKKKFPRILRCTASHKIMFHSPSRGKKVVCRTGHLFEGLI